MNSQNTVESVAKIEQIVETIFEIIIFIHKKIVLLKLLTHLFNFKVDWLY